MWPNVQQTINATETAKASHADKFKRSRQHFLFFLFQTTLFLTTIIFDSTKIPVSTMVQHDKKDSDDRSNEIISDDKTRCDSLKSDISSPEPVGSSEPLKTPRTEMGFTRTERNHAMSPAASNEREKSPGLSHFGQNDQAWSASPR